MTIFLKIIVTWVLISFGVAFAGFLCIIPGLILMFFTLFVSNAIIYDPKIDVLFPGHRPTALQPRRHPAALQCK